MAKWIWLGIVTIVAGVAASVALLVFGLDPQSKSERGKGAADDAAPSPARASRSLFSTAGSDPNMDVLLLEEDTPETWQKIIALYPRSDEATKRKVLHRIGELKSLERTLALLLATVGDDPLPASDDAMVNEAAQLMKDRWQTAEDMEAGRRAMLMQETDKRRWVAANAMITFAKDVPEDSPLYAQTQRLKAKLVNVHKSVEDPFVKSSIVQGMHALGAGDAALILAKGPKVRDEELAGVRAEKAATDEVLNSVGSP